MIGAAHQVVLVRDVEVPQHAMQKLRPVVRVDEIVVADLYIDRQRRFADAIAFAIARLAGLFAAKSSGSRAAPMSFAGPPVE